MFTTLLMLLLLGWTINAYRKQVERKKMDQMRYDDPERWSRITSAEDARRQAARRSGVENGIKIASMFLKR